MVVELYYCKDWVTILVRWPETRCGRKAGGRAYCVFYLHPSSQYTLNRRIILFSLVCLNSQNLLGLFSRLIKKKSTAHNQTDQENPRGSFSLKLIYQL
jgi:hypothetical protein